jgi:hypothetical protein
VDASSALLDPEQIKSMLRFSGADQAMVAVRAEMVNLGAKKTNTGQSKHFWQECYSTNTMLAGVHAYISGITQATGSIALQTHEIDLKTRNRISSPICKTP